MMMLNTHALRAGGLLSLAAVDDDAIAVVCAGGGGATLKMDGPARAAIWIPLRGRIHLNVGGLESIVQKGEVRVTEPDRVIHANGPHDALWLVMLATQATWTKTLGRMTDVRFPEPILLPARYIALRALRRKALELMRAARDGLPDAAANAFIDNVFSLQLSLAPAIARCPGRTYAQRRQVFLRLQRVRDYLTSNCHLELDNDALARMASYSSWHFIRAFRAVYQETPHAYLVNQRLQLARRLLHSSRLAITEIAAASGFEDRCAFSRLFRQRFGTTARAVRKQNLQRLSALN